MQVTYNSAARRKWLQTVWKNVSTFMTDKWISHPQPSDGVWYNSYGWKVKIYTYLPDVQETRDWLEKVYKK